MSERLNLGVRGWMAVLPLISAGISTSLLLGALAFQYVGGLAPCHMCMTQRWAHVVVVLLSLIALMRMNRATSAMGLMASCYAFFAGAHHAGVEYGWWSGPTDCSGSSLSGISTEQLLEQIMSAPLVRCDAVAWEVFGISLAGFNALLTLPVLGMWVLALSLCVGRRRNQ